MKNVIAGGVVTVSTLLSNAYATPVCKAAAIRVARQHSKASSVVSSVAILPSKANEESYRVALIDSINDKSELIDVTMNSDGSLVSVIPR